MDLLFIDIATAPLPNARDYIVGTVKAPSNYKKPEAISEYIREETDRRVAMAATDFDLCRVTAIGLHSFTAMGNATDQRCVLLAKDEDDERAALGAVALILLKGLHRTVTFGGLQFDLPILMRRSAYLGLEFPTVSLDRYRGQQIDLCEAMAFGSREKMRSLQWYAKRLGWTDLVKPLSGEEESRVFDSNAWEALKASVEHDVVALERLARWTGVMG